MENKDNLLLLSKQLKEKEEALRSYEEAATAQREELLEKYEKTMRGLNKVISNGTEKQ
jgi:uncharacterized protein YqeY